jgi:hypothetical protein
MRKVLLMCTALSFLVSVASAANFQPRVLKLIAPANIQYQFDGKKLDIPFEVTGTPAGVILSVYTNGKAGSVKKVTNGYLGWHYMNLVDTCIYFSGLSNYGVGKNNIISWLGKDKGGALAPAGDYTYYLWAYDNISAKVQVCYFLRLPSASGGNQALIQEKGTDGKTLANPLFYGWYGQTKWTIGNDPLTASLLETTTYSLGSGYSRAKVISLQPDNFNFYYLNIGNTTTKIKGVRKMQWVPNGLSQFVTTWADNGFCSWSGIFDADGGCISNGDVVYNVDNAYHGYNDNKPLSDFYYIDGTDGSIIKKVDMTNWWSSISDFQAGAQINGGPNGYDFRNGYLFLNSHSSCLKQMVNPAAETADAFVLWSNKNGDYIFDKNWEASSKYKWACNDYRAEPETYEVAPDHNLFSMGAAYDIGAISFGLMGPDGQGMGYYSFAGELALKVNQGRWNIIVDSNTAYDGIYMDNYADADTSKEGGLWFVAQNSFKGKISNNVGVKEAAPSAFSVSQNTPNPFNPATTISFVIPKAGNVTVEVFNVGGQKVDTITNTFMGAGNHSVTWNAMKHSAGTYFYTVKTKDASKTVKMTLLK